MAKASDVTNKPLVPAMRFKPAPDISAYDLAVILQRHPRLDLTLSPEQVLELPLSMRRHWRTVG